MSEVPGQTPCASIRLAPPVHGSSGHPGPNRRSWPLPEPPGPRYTGSARAFGRPTQENRARHVAAITAEYSTLVEDDQFVFPQRFGGGCACAHAERAPGSHNRFKRGAARHLALDAIFDLGCEIQFADSRLDEAEDFVKTR